MPRTSKNSWGGARVGAGRRVNRYSGVSHLRRPSLSRRHPVHVTLRVLRIAARLRGSRRFRAIWRALRAGRERFGFRLIHFSVQSDHLHLVVEAENRRSLTRGVQGLSVRIARALNRVAGRRGRVFADRYHSRTLRTAKAVRTVLRYVFANKRRHDAKRGAPFPAGFVDGCSSAPFFDGWREPEQARACIIPRPPDNHDPPTAVAKTFLLRRAWRRHGLVSIHEAPARTPILTEPPRRV